MPRALRVRLDRENQGGTRKVLSVFLTLGSVELVRKFVGSCCMVRLLNIVLLVALILASCMPAPLRFYAPAQMWSLVG
jgi:hypothetical protein